jgi:predicted nucleic acid-binding protein
MIVVADTSPLNYLIRLGHIDVLRQLYGRILIPHAVHHELLRLKAPAAVRTWAANPPEWLELLSPSTTPTQSQSRLDPGESEAIALAEELHADWLLIDDAAGRDHAVAIGLQTIGTLGILREAAREGLLDLRVEVVRLRSLGFYVSDILIVTLLASL